MNLRTPHLASVFLAHSSRNKQFARKLASDLEQYNINVWLDEAEIRVGDSLVWKIMSAIGSVDFLAILLSKQSVNSNWVKEEVSVAFHSQITEKSIKLLPILKEPCEFPNFLRDKLYADLSTTKKYKANFPKLVRAITDWPSALYSQAWALQYVNNLKTEAYEYRQKLHSSLSFGPYDKPRCIIYVLEQFASGFPRERISLGRSDVRIGITIPHHVYNGQEEIDTNGWVFSREVAENLFSTRKNNEVSLSQTGQEVLVCLRSWGIE